MLHDATLSRVTHSEGADRLLRIEDVAELANVHRATVNRWIARGDLVPIGYTPVPAGSTRERGAPRFTRQQVLDLLRNPRQIDTEDDLDPEVPLAAELLGELHTRPAR